jgi:hypothetical protein
MIVQAHCNMPAKQLIVVRLLYLEPVLQVSAVFAQVWLIAQHFQNPTFVVRLPEPRYVNKAFEYLLLFLFDHDFSRLRHLECLD